MNPSAKSSERMSSRLTNNAIRIQSSERTLSWLTPRLFVGMLNDTTYELSSERTPCDVYSVLSEDSQHFVRPHTPRRIVGLTTKSSSPRTSI